MKKILLVDDLKGLIDKEKSILDRTDFNIFTATSSDEALKIHKSIGMDLIVVDLDMPGTSGDELCTMIREDEEMKNVSIVVVCTNSKADMKRAEQCKANDCVTKPIRPVELLRKVSRLMDIQERKSYRVLLKVTVKGSLNNASFFCTSQNISTTGILIETERTLEVGDNISCSFYLPNSGAVSLDGEVVRTSGNARDGFQYGVRYMIINPGHRVEIEKFIKKRSAK
jgi:CheY-like chemotaxis protein